MPYDEYNVQLQRSMQDLTIHCKRIIEWEFTDKGQQIALKLTCFFKGHYVICKQSGAKYCYRCLKELKK